MIKTWEQIMNKIGNVDFDIHGRFFMIDHFLACINYKNMLGDQAHENFKK